MRSCSRWPVRAFAHSAYDTDHVSKTKVGKGNVIPATRTAMRISFSVLIVSNRVCATIARLSIPPWHEDQGDDCRKRRPLQLEGPFVFRPTRSRGTGDRLRGFRTGIPPRLGVGDWSASGTLSLHAFDCPASLGADAARMIP